MEESTTHIEEKDIRFISGPALIRLKKIELPVPPQIPRGTFEAELPRIQALTHFDLAFPKLNPLKNPGLHKRLPINELSRALDMTEEEVQISILETEQKLRYALSKRLDKLLGAIHKNKIK